ARFRADHLMAIVIQPDAFKDSAPSSESMMFSGVGSEGEVREANAKKIEKFMKKAAGTPLLHVRPYSALSEDGKKHFPCPDCEQRGTMTEPRQFNLMFETYVGAVRD